MVQQSAAALDKVFHALAHPARRAILSNLARGEYSLTDLAQRSGMRRMSFAAASKHVRVLERAGLVKRRIEGRTHICRIAPKPLKGAEEWLSFFEAFWNKRLDALEALFAGEAEAPKPKTKRRKPK